MLGRGFNSPELKPNKKTAQVRSFYLVEARGVEPLSENLSTRLSTSVVDVLAFLWPQTAPINRIRAAVAS